MSSPEPVVLYQQARATRTRVEILAVAVDLASAEGLEGLSIGRLATELRMSKTGIFAHFGSKEQLQLATVSAAKEIFLEQIVKPSLDSPRGLPKLKSMLESWLGYVERIVFRGGCFFAAASAEFDSRPGKVRDEIASLTKAWLMGSCIRAKREADQGFGRSSAARVRAARLRSGGKLGVQVIRRQVGIFPRPPGDCRSTRRGFTWFGQ
jgi:AcrR family transcriptional regulator